MNTNIEANTDGAVIAALRVAADALDIAADWNVDRLELGDAPIAFGLHPDPDDDEPGWYDTRSLADALRELAGREVQP